MGGTHFIKISGVRVDLFGSVPEKQSRLASLGKRFLISGKPMAVVECDCGVILVARADHLASGGTTSCGCCHREMLVGRNTTHGLARSSEHKSWRHMKSRCFNSSDESYANYGERGITVCDRWTNSFEAFYADMGPKPTPRHSIDRFPDNNGNYEPGNCRWATTVEQANNKRNNHILTIDGDSRTMAEWSQVSLVPSATIRTRLALGWSHRDAVMKPVCNRSRSITSSQQ